MESSDHQSYLVYICFIKDFILTVIATGMKFNYRKGDYASMNEILSGKDWQTLFDASNIEENWLMFKNLLSDLADRFIP